MKNKTISPFHRPIFTEKYGPRFTDSPPLDYKQIAHLIIELSVLDLKRIKPTTDPMKIIQAYRFLFGEHKSDYMWRSFWFRLAGLDQEKFIDGLRYKLLIRNWPKKEMLVSSIKKWEAGIAIDPDEWAPIAPPPSLTTLYQKIRLQERQQALSQRVFPCVM